ncbi:Hairy/enhancer-of-split with YRPW motif protein 2 [Pleurotus ostreatus]|nr:Hairy/enhancer-of-split with YRPW motif protein 2 [Pleurotus ostreatus]
MTKKRQRDTESLDAVFDRLAGSFPVAGFELFTDFMFADFLVTRTPFVSSVVFQYVQSFRPAYSNMSNGNYPGPNLIPWFVSDVTPPDFSVTISSLLDPSFFPPPATADETVDPSLPSDLFRMVSRWRKYVDDGMKLSILLDTSLGVS